MSDHSVHKISVFDEDISISFEQISALMRPNIQQVVINLAQLSSAAYLFNLLKYVLAQHNQHGNLYLGYACKFSMPN